MLFARTLRPLVFVATLLLPAPFMALAEEPSPAPAPTEMETVTVTGQAEDSLSGSHTLGGETLRQLPLKNGSISETLTVLPNIQAGEQQRTSERAGEILPPLISISGARPYESYFAVDGVGLNSLLDPLADNVFKLDSVPGHPLRTFTQRNLIESVTVYDSNVPARYGQFLGGVVDARTRNPAAEPGGRLSLRTTRDEWARQHVHDTREDAFEESRYFDLQPRYRKYQAGVEFDLPLNETMGVLAAYQTTRSRLAINHLGVERDFDKVLDNYFLKYLWTPDAARSLELSAVYTPAEEEFIYKDTKDSDLDIRRGGHALNAIYTERLPSGELTISAAYLQSENSRQAPNAYFSWLKTPSRDWGNLLGTTRSLQGGFGDIDTAEKSLQLKVDYQLDPVALGALTHTVGFGAAFTRGAGEYDRKEPAITYNTAVANAGVTCLDGDPACVPGEQYFNARNIYPAQRSAAVIHQKAYYLEDLIAVGRFTLRPGFRVSSDDFLGSTEFAHRLAGGWDLFGDGSTRIIGGLNRYYGEALLTYKLREAIAPHIRETRATPAAPWTGSAQKPTLTRFSTLDTPYSDEWTMGIDQKLLGGTLFLKHIDRRHRNQFARETIEDAGQKYYILNNNGASDYQSWSAKWERAWARHYLNVNYTYAETKSTGESYDASLDTAALAEEVWYDGKFVTRDELPRIDYFRPHVVNLVYVGRLPWGLTFTNVARYRSGYEALVRLTNAEKTALGLPTTLTAYHKDRRSSSCLFDWRLDWERAIFRDQTLTLTLEVNNVFNRKVADGESKVLYELGREFWLGVAYKF